MTHDDTPIETSEADARPWRGEVDDLADRQAQQRHIEYCQADPAPRSAGASAPAAQPRAEAAPWMQSTEHHIALREAHEIAAEHDYFDARPNRDGQDQRAIFDAGFRRGFDAAAKLAAEAAPVAQPATAPVVPANVVAWRYDWVVSLNPGFIEAGPDADRLRLGQPPLLGPDSARTNWKALTDASAPAAPVVPQPAAQGAPNLSCKSVQARLAAQWGYVPAAQQGEAVAWAWRHPDGEIDSLYVRRDDCERDAIGYEGKSIPLYTAPPARQAVALTGERIAELWVENGSDAEDAEGFASAVIAEFCRVNGITPTGGERENG